MAKKDDDLIPFFDIEPARKEADRLTHVFRSGGRAAGRRAETERLFVAVDHGADPPVTVHLWSDFKVIRVVVPEDPEVTEEQREKVRLFVHEKAQEWVRRMQAELAPPIDVEFRVLPPDGVPCRHPGCLSHISHPCEGCGRIGGRRLLTEGGE